MSKQTRMGQVRSGGIPAAALSPDDSATRAGTKLAAVRGQTARGDFVTLPEFGRVWMKLVGHKMGNSIEGQVVEEMNRAKIPLTVGFGLTMDTDKKARVLAYAVFVDDDPTNGLALGTTAFGSLAEWLDEDDDVIIACYYEYHQLRERLDPFGMPTLTEQRAAEIIEAFKKKDPMLFLSFELKELCIFLASGAVQLATSPTPSSSSGESSPESSEEPTPSSTE